VKVRKLRQYFEDRRLEMEGRFKFKELEKRGKYRRKNNKNAI